MKRPGIILASVLAVLITAASYAEEKKADPYQLFYTANHNYESRDYLKAVEGYVAILESGLESGNLYYNIGNGFLKMGSLGHAILCYERAKRLIPHDSDLKANLSYARSLVESANTETQGNFILNALDAIFGLYSLRAIIFSATILYLLLLLLIGLFIAKPFFARRFRAVLVLVVALFILNLSAVAARYFDERILKHGIVVQKEVECKYEPIEKSTTYYTLHEGREVLILNTRNGWRQVRRPDGKISWVKKEAVEEI
ncbi:MAG: tetratricopeptide repeat protein [Candidatus Omnitrophica bacterium]|nr:tetratricopeptide repeat protein [Candidatus Omnitrophota bacterium]